MVACMLYTIDVQNNIGMERSQIKKVISPPMFSRWFYGNSK